MPSVSQIIALARTQWNASVQQIDDNTMLDFFNNVYHDLENDIVRYVDEDYYYDIQYADLVANQIEYIIPQSTSSISGFKKLKDISLKFVNDSFRIDSYDTLTKEVILQWNYSDLSSGQTLKFTNKEWYLIGTDIVDTVIIPGIKFTITTWLNLSQWNCIKVFDGIEYIKAKSISTSNMSMDESIYRSQQAVYNAMYKISDKSIFIYPVATQNVTNWLKIYAIRDQVDLDLLATESEVNIPRQYHNYISMGMLPRMYQYRQMFNEKQLAEAKYADKKDDLLKDLSNRNSSPIEAGLPPLSYLS